MKKLILTTSFAALAVGAFACSSSKSNMKTDEAQGALNADESFRNKQPAPGAAPKIVTPKFQRAEIGNGLTVIVAESHELPIVAIDVAFASGSSQDPRGKAGTASLSYGLLLEGAGGKDALQLADAFGDLGATASVATTADGAMVGTHVLKKNAEAALALLSQVVQKPTFAQADFDRRKGEQLANLALQSSTPQYLAQEAFEPAVFGETHPYGHLNGGSVKSVESIKLADVKSFYATRAGPKAAALVIAGDVTLEQAKEWAAKYFGAWKSNAIVPAAPVAPAATARKQVTVVPKADLKQTIVVVGRPAIAAGSADEPALELANHIFGGYFGSRLNMNLRESKGYTYGARGGYDDRRGVGAVRISSAVRADVTGPALGEVFNELNGLKTKPITAEELAQARESVVRAIPGKFEDVDSLASTGASLFFTRQPLDRLDKLIEGVQAADAATVQAVAQKYYDPASMQIVLVGDPAIIQTQVGALNLGTLKTRAPAAPAAPAKKAAAPAAGATGARP